MCIRDSPTVLFLGEGSTGQQPLISEALRGEGAFLVDGDGTRIMAGRHPLEDLAPRDVVARAILDVMRDQGVDHVWLDARHLGGAFLEQRFPSIVARCRELGFDPAVDLLPVAPAQHYASGGVETDLLALKAVLLSGRAMRRPKTEVDEIFDEIKLRLQEELDYLCLLYTSPSPRDRTRSRMPSSA